MLKGVWLVPILIGLVLAGRNVDGSMEAKAPIAKAASQKIIEKESDAKSLDEKARFHELNGKLTLVPMEVGLFHSKEDMPKKEEKELLFVGDSRFVGMEAAIESEYEFFCEVGKGFRWYEEHQEEIESMVESDTIVVFGLGVNDLYNGKAYLTLEGSPYFDRMYFLSVNPVDEEKEERYGYKVTNEEIDAFNEAMKALFGDRYIDVNTYLVEAGFETRDGLHYRDETYKDIYGYILESLGFVNK